MEPTEADLEAFVRRRVGSVWALELLLLMRREPDRCWPPAALVGELRASGALVEDILHRFEQGGLVSPELPGYRFAPASLELERLCTALEVAYRGRRVAVINMIARPVDPLQSLADAFKLKGREK